MRETSRWSWNFLISNASWIHMKRKLIRNMAQLEMTSTGNMALQRNIETFCFSFFSFVSFSLFCRCVDSNIQFIVYINMCQIQYESFFLVFASVLVAGRHSKNPRCLSNFEGIAHYVCLLLCSCRAQNAQFPSAVWLFRLLWPVVVSLLYSVCFLLCLVLDFLTRNGPFSFRAMPAQKQTAHKWKNQAKGI